MDPKKVSNLDSLHMDSRTLHNEQMIFETMGRPGNNMNTVFIKGQSEVIVCVTRRFANWFLERNTEWTELLQLSNETVREVK